MDVNDILWYVKLPGQDKFVPPDQREELPIKEVEALLKLPEYDAKAMDEELDRKWRALKTELLEAEVEVAECGDGKVVDRACEQDASLAG